jgi:hypothetical protein
MTVVAMKENNVKRHYETKHSTKWKALEGEFLK